MLNNYPDVLTVKQLAEALNIGLNAAYELVNRHEIGAKRIGRAIQDNYAELMNESIDLFVRMRDVLSKYIRAEA